MQEEGNKVKLAMTWDRIIVDGTKSVHGGKTKLSDNQIMGLASHIFKRLLANNCNVLIDNCQSFAIFLCESILGCKARVPYILTSRAGGRLLGVLLSWLVLTVVGDLSTEGGKKRIEAWKEGMHEAIDKEVGCFGQNISAPGGLPYPANVL